MASCPGSPRPQARARWCWKLRPCAAPGECHHAQDGGRIRGVAPHRREKPDGPPQEVGHFAELPARKGTQSGPGLQRPADEELGGLFEACLFGERHGIPSAIEEPSVLDLRDARLEHGQTPIERGRGRSRGTAETDAALDQRLHVVGRIEALAGVVRRREGAHEPRGSHTNRGLPAGCRGGRRHRRSGEGAGSAEGPYVDILIQD